MINSSQLNEVIKPFNGISFKTQANNHKKTANNNYNNDI